MKQLLFTADGPVSCVDKAIKIDGFIHYFIGADQSYSVSCAMKREMFRQLFYSSIQP